MATAEIDMEKMRPNIRIEIHNNLTENEKMDVDESFKSENEEGEIIEDNETLFLSKSAPEVTHKIWPITKGVFTTGINIFDKQEQEKLQERARRFALKPDEIHNFTDSDLDELHYSLGITPENEDNVRFDAVHMLGIGEMSTEDVLEYFIKYAPTGIEWIDNDSCNVIWSENISAARAMFYVSKVVQGMPARESCDTFAKEFLDDIEEPESEGTGRSILLKNKNREVELKVDNECLSEILPNKHNFKNAVDISEITIPIPPGYWRLGEKYLKAKCLLMRFALKTDKKPYKAEKFSKYYKKYGSSKGVISESKKKELRGIFERNKELNQEKNPWGSLAKNWDHDVKFREREPEIIEEPKIELKNPSILVRLGTKRKQENSDNEQEVVINVEEETGEKERRKSKLPRMRMYADEEEEKLKTKKILQTIKKQTEKLSKQDYLYKRDLRNVLSITNRRALEEDIPEPDPEVVDLGTKLRNRTKNMVFTVERDVADIEIYDRKENVRSDIRSLIEERRARSPVHRRRISPPHWSPERRRSPEYRRRDLIRRPRSPLRRSPLLRRTPVRRRKSPERTLHSDRMYVRHRHKRRNSDDSSDGVFSQKPKSKVAVVIKTQKKPTVASTIWSRVQRQSESESSSDSVSSKSEETSSSEESESEESEESSSTKGMKHVERPGFQEVSNKKFKENVDYRSPLKITMTNDHFKKK